MSTVQSREIILHASPNSGTPSNSSAGHVQIMHLELSDDVLEQLLESNRKGKVPKMQFGPNPVLRFNGNAILVEARQTNIAHEIYKREKEQGGDMDYVGSVSHALTLQMEEASAGVDRALEQLEQSMTKYKQESEAKKTVITPDMPPIKHGNRFKSSSRHLSPSSSSPSNFRQTQTSITSNAKMVRGDRFPSHVAHVDELVDERSPEEAIRYALIHLLAIKPFSVGIIETKLRMGGKVDKIMLVLTQITTGTNAGGEYCLGRKAFKELEPWEFPYSCQSDRDEAIKGAVQAFDQMRIEKTDLIWDILVKPEERGKGIILSRLNLQDKQIWRSPIMKPQIDRVARNMHEKPQSKAKAPKKGEIASNGSSNAKLTTQQRTKLQPMSSGSPLPSADKPSAAAKSLLNQPKNPSPLAASPVNASELERTHPVHRTLSASPTKGSNSTYRAGDPIFGNSKRPPTKKSPVYTPIDNPTKQTSVTKSAEKRKAEDDLEAAPPRKIVRDSNIVRGTKRQIIHPPRMKNPTTSSNKPTTSKHTSSYSSAAYVRSSTSESSSSEYELSERQRVKLGLEWKRIYPIYAKKYEQVSKKSNPTQAEKDELMKLHHKMESMKRQLHSKRI